MDDYIKRGDILGTTRLLDTNIVWRDKVASWLLDQILYDIEHTPAADAVPVLYGEWIYDSNTDEPRCSECGEDALEGVITPYCPHCGAMMDEEDKNNGTHQ